MKLVAVLPVGIKPEGSNNNTVIEPGSDFEIADPAGEQLLLEGSAAKPGTKEARAAIKAARLAAGAEDDDED